MNVTIERRCEAGWRDEGRSALINFLDAHAFDALSRFQIQVTLLQCERYEDERWRLRKVAA